MSTMYPIKTFRISPQMPIQVSTNQGIVNTQIPRMFICYHGSCS